MSDKESEVERLQQPGYYGAVQGEVHKTRQAKRDDKARTRAENTTSWTGKVVASIFRKAGVEKCF